MLSSKIKLEASPHWYNLERFHPIFRIEQHSWGKIFGPEKCSQMLFDPKWTIRSWSSIQEQTIWYGPYPKFMITRQSADLVHFQNVHFGSGFELKFWTKSASAKQIQNLNLICINLFSGPEIGPLCYVESLSYLWQRSPEMHSGYKVGCVVPMIIWSG